MSPLDLFGYSLAVTGAILLLGLGLLLLFAGFLFLLGSRDEPRPRRDRT